jgi:WD40 repeat protein
LLASGADDGTVNLWDITDGKLLRTFRGPRAEVVGVAFDPTGRTLARGSTDGTVILWDTANGALPRLFERHRSPVCSVGFEPSGHMLAVGSLDNTVRLWDVPNSKLRRILEGHRGSVVALSFHRQRPLLATMGWDDTIRVWSSETWDVIAVIQRRARYRFRGLSFHPSLPRLAVAGARLHVYELDLDVLLGERQLSEAPRTVHYVNAKVVLASFSAGDHFRRRIRRRVGRFGHSTPRKNSCPANAGERARRCCGISPASLAIASFTNCI